MLTRSLLDEYMQTRQRSGVPDNTYTMAKSTIYAIPLIIMIDFARAFEYNSVEFIYMPRIQCVYLYDRLDMTSSYPCELFTFCVI